MRSTYGIFWACLALTGLTACSSAAPPPPEGNATVNFSGSSCGFPSQSINGPAGAPTASSINGTVLDGTNGVRVSCTVSKHGTYSVHAKIESSGMTLSIESGDIASGALMTFYTDRTPNSMSSVDATNNQAPSCTLTVRTVKVTDNGGSIFASYLCPSVKDPASVSQDCRISGDLTFTGCET